MHTNMIIQSCCDSSGNHSVFWKGLRTAFRGTECLRVDFHLAFYQVCSFRVGSFCIICVSTVRPGEL